MEKEMICIVCPMGCHLRVKQDGKNIEVVGNQCNRGEAYAIKELSAPTRMLTSTVKIHNGIYKRLPVITSSDIPFEKMWDVMQEINQVEVQAPIKYQDVIIENVCGLNVNIIASRSMKRKS